MISHSSPSGVLRVGMFGGSFDPPHLAHRELAATAVQQLGLDRLYILPTGQAWYKTRPLSASRHRLAMCEQAFGDLPRVHLDARETERSGPSYTADTLAELAQEHPGAELFLVLGADQLMAFKSWVRWEDVLQCATLAVANRAIQLGAEADSCQPAQQDLASVGVPFVPLQMPLRNISATAVRAHVRGQSRRYPDLDVLVPEGVARYISDHHLYEDLT